MDRMIELEEMDNLLVLKQQVGIVVSSKKGQAPVIERKEEMSDEEIKKVTDL